MVKKEINGHKLDFKILAVNSTEALNIVSDICGMNTTVFLKVGTGDKVEKYKNYIVYHISVAVCPSD